MSIYYLIFIMSNICQLPNSNEGAFYSKQKTHKQKLTKQLKTTKT